jgi:hypothetical protein
MSGWIKLHRQILEWEWYSNNNCFRLFLHLLLKANHKERRFKGMELEIGTIVTSRDLLARETGLTGQQIRTALNKLISTNELTSVSSPQGTIIQIVNYEKYQIATNEITNEQPTSNQRATTNNNIKNNKENTYRRFAHLSLSFQEYNKLAETWNEDQINTTLDEIENYKKNNQYKSLFLTAKKWLGKNFPNGKQMELSMDLQFTRNILAQLNEKDDPNKYRNND